MELDCTDILTAALILVIWMCVAVPFGLLLGALIHHAQHGPPGHGASASPEWC